MDWETVSCLRDVSDQTGLGVWEKLDCFQPPMASSTGSQGSGQHSGEEERSAEEAGQERQQRRLGAGQEPGQPEEVSLSAAVLPLFSVACSGLNKASFPRGRPVSVASDGPEEEEEEERASSAPVEEPVSSAPPAGQGVAAHLRKADVRDPRDQFHGRKCPSVPKTLLPPADPA